MKIANSKYIKSVLIAIMYFTIQNISVAQIGGNILGSQEVCPNTEHDYNLDTSYPPGGTEIIYWGWEVEGGLITKVFFDDGNESDINATSFDYAAMVDPATAPSPVRIRVKWGEAATGVVKLKVEKQGQKFNAGNIGIITFTVLVDATLTVDINEIVDDGITYVSSYLACDENDVIFVKGEKGTSYLGRWFLDDNMSSNGTVDGFYTIKPKPGFSGKMTATYKTYCGLEVVHSFTVDIWVGPPAQPVLSLPNDLDCLEAGSAYTIFAESEGATSYQWAVPASWSSAEEDNTGNQNLTYVGEQSGSVSVWAYNECGSSSVNLPIEVCEDDIVGGTTGTTGNPKGGGRDIPVPFTNNSNNTDSRSSINSSNILIYPNPTSDHVNVDIKFEENKIYNFELQNVYGQILVKERLFQKEINLHNIPSGILFLILKEGNKPIETYKIIKK